MTVSQSRNCKQTNKQKAATQASVHGGVDTHGAAFLTVNYAADSERKRTDYPEQHGRTLHTRR